MPYPEAQECIIVQLKDPPMVKDHVMQQPEPLHAANCQQDHQQVYRQHRDAVEVVHFKHFEVPLEGKMSLIDNLYQDNLERSQTVAKRT